MDAFKFKLQVLLFLIVIFALSPSLTNAGQKWTNPPTPSPKALCENRCVRICVQFFDRCANEIPTEPLTQCRLNCDSKGGSEQEITNCYDACYSTFYLAQYENCEEERFDCEDICYDVICINEPKQTPVAIAVTTPQPIPSFSATAYPFRPS